MRPSLIKFRLAARAARVDIEPEALDSHSDIRDDEVDVEALRKFGESLRGRLAAAGISASSSVRERFLWGVRTYGGCDKSSSGSGRSNSRNFEI